MALKQSAEEFCERMSNVCDDLYVAIEAKNTADQHTALAALIGLVEMLRSEIDDAEDINGDPD
jgi:molecular chaperone GrpE (heat shock protein)